MDDTQLGEYRVRVEDDNHGIFVTAETAAAIRGDANRQADMHLQEAIKLWDECDVEDIEEVKAVEWQVSLALHALVSLRMLAPLDDEDADA